MGFDEVRFPTNISYGSKGGPGFRTNVIVSDSGSEQRIPRWTNARRQYNVAYGVHSNDDLVALSDFYIQRNGVANGFRYKDWLDFTSAPDRRGAPTATDQLVDTADGAATDYQLVTRYGLKVRNIIKPVETTVRVALDGVEQMSGWTVDTTTGIITFDTAPAAGVEITAGFEFDVPVRFGTEVDDTLQLSLDDFGYGSSQNIPLIELFDGIATYDDVFFGGAWEQIMSTDLQVTLSKGRVWVLDPQSADLKAKLPSTATLSPGAPIFYIFNESGTNDLLVTTSGGTTIATLAAGEACEVILAVSSDNATRTWYVL